MTRNLSISRRATFYEETDTGLKAENLKVRLSIRIF